MSTEIKEQKEKLKAIVLECYQKSYDRQFNGLNISKLQHQSILKKIKLSFEVLDCLDPNSQIYKSLISVARKAATELNTKCYAEWYKILIEQLVTLPEEVKNKISKNVIFFPEKEIVEKKKEEQIKKIEITKQRFIPEGITGNKLKKIVTEEKDFNNELLEMDLDFEEEEFELEDDSTEDISELNL